jgi:hypothetical protein
MLGDWYYFNAGVRMQRQSISRLTIERLSINPISAIIGSIQTAVDNVHSNQHGRLSHIISR